MSVFSLGNVLDQHGQPCNWICACFVIQHLWIKLCVGRFSLILFWLPMFEKCNTFSQFPTLHFYYADSCLSKYAYNALTGHQHCNLLIPATKKWKIKHWRRLHLQTSRSHVNHLKHKHTVGNAGFIESACNLLTYLTVYNGTKKNVISASSDDWMKASVSQEL